MSNRAAQCIVSLFLVVLFPASSMLAETGAAAMLYTSGAVMVNGTGAPRTAALFRGDAVQTKDGGAVTISLAGSTVLVPANSKVVLRSDGMELNAGVVEVNTTKGLAAHAEAFSIAPANSGNAKFQVARLSDAIMVTAERGAVTVTGGGNTVNVAEGGTEMLDLQAQGQAPVEGPPPAGATGGAKLDKKKAAFILLAAGTGGVIVALLLGSGAPTVTPVVP